MSEPVIVIRFDGNGRIYCPGETLAGQYRLQGVHPSRVKAVEVSVLWYTEGKGDEDLAVHEFWRLNADDAGQFDPTRPQPFSTTLPNCPLSYDGQIIHLRWCVRVRAFLGRTKEVVGQKIFRLGDVPAVKVAEP